MQSARAYISCMLVLLFVATAKAGGRFGEDAMQAEIVWPVAGANAGELNGAMLNEAALAAKAQVQSQQAIRNSREWALREQLHNMESIKEMQVDEASEPLPPVFQESNDALFHESESSLAKQAEMLRARLRNMGEGEAAPEIQIPEGLVARETGAGDVSHDQHRGAEGGDLLDASLRGHLQETGLQLSAMASAANAENALVDREISKVVDQEVGKLATGMDSATLAAESVRKTRLASASADVDRSFDAALPLALEQDAAAEEMANKKERNAAPTAHVQSEKMKLPEHMARGPAAPQPALTSGNSSDEALATKAEALRKKLELITHKPPPPPLPAATGAKAVESGKAAGTGKVELTSRNPPPSSLPAKAGAQTAGGEKALVARNLLSEELGKKEAAATPAPEEVRKKAAAAAAAVADEGVDAELRKDGERGANAAIAGKEAATTSETAAAATRFASDHSNLRSTPQKLSRHQEQQQRRQRRLHRVEKGKRGAAKERGAAQMAKQRVERARKAEVARKFGEILKRKGSC